MKKLTTFNIAALSLLGTTWLFSSGGPLDPPPGAPSSNVYKTLDEVEARTPISAAGTVISTPGSYYLTGNITGASGQNGITIGASWVTLDLNGFNLDGGGKTSGSLDGILVNGSFGSITIGNGTISNWDGDGIDAVDSGRCTIRRLNCRENGDVGINAGTTSTIERCLVADNIEAGIQTKGFCLVRDNHVLSNGFLSTHVGIKVTGNGSRIENNYIANSPTNLQVVTSGNFIMGNTSWAINTPPFQAHFTIAPDNAATAIVPWNSMGTNTFANANFTYD